MSVHYKFKSALDFDTVTFDGLHISVADLKSAISQQKRIGKTSDFDLQVTNAQTKEVYVDDNTLIPKNASLLIARVPLSQKPKKSRDFHNNGIERNREVVTSKGVSDLLLMEGSEQDKINAMISQSTVDYDPSNYQKLKGYQRGEVPANYRCRKCHKSGHWIRNCPFVTSAAGGENIEIKRSTGIPQSFMIPVEDPKAPGAMMTPAGNFAVPAVDREAYQTSEETQPAPSEPVQREIPDELVCSLCKDILVDAVMIPCCGDSFCDECIRNTLLESEEHECPHCREKEILPTTLIPNRYLRNAVATFRNQTGYNRQLPHKPKPEIVYQKVSGQPQNAEEAWPESDGSAEDGITVTVPPPSQLLAGPPPPQNHVVPQTQLAPTTNHHHQYQPRYRGPPPPRFGPSQINVHPSNMMRGLPPGVPPRLMDDQRSGTPTVDERREQHMMPPQAMMYNRPPVPPSGAPYIPPPSVPYGQPPHFAGPPPGQFAPGNVPVRASYPPPNYPLRNDLPPRVGPPPPFHQPPPPGIKEEPIHGSSEDPLEAFNRMIREKEERARRRKRFSHSRSRSRSFERLPFSRSRSRSRSRSWTPRRRLPPPRPPSRPSHSPILRVLRSPRRRRETSLSLSRSPSPRRRRTPPRYRSPLRRVSPLHNRYPPSLEGRGSPIREAAYIPPRYESRDNGVLPPYKSPKLKALPAAVDPDSSPGYRGRFEDSIYDDIPPPGTEPPVPGYEPSPFELRDGLPHLDTLDRERGSPNSIPYSRPYNDPANKDYRGGPAPPYRDGPPPEPYRELPIPTSYRDTSSNYRGPGSGYRENQPPYRDNQPPFRDNLPPFRDNQPPFRDNQPPFRDNQPPFRDNQPPFRDNQVPFRDNQPPYRDNQPPFRNNQLPYRGPPQVFRDASSNSYRDQPSFRSEAPYRSGSRGPYPEPNYRDSHKEESRDNRDYRPRDQTRRANTEREKRREPRDRDGKRDREYRSKHDRDIPERYDDRSDRHRDPDRTRDERDKEFSPEKRKRHSASPKRARSRDKKLRRVSATRDEIDVRREKEKVKEKPSEEKHKDNKEKKNKDKKKKKKEKEVDKEKKKKKDRKDKKDKELSTVEEDEETHGQENSSTLNIESQTISNEVDKNQKTEVEGTTSNVPIEENKNISEKSEHFTEAKNPKSYENIKDQDIFEDIEEKSIEANKNQKIFEDKDFDGIDLQAAAEELELKGEVDYPVTDHSDEMLANLPEPSRWEVEDEIISGKKVEREPGEILSPEIDSKVTNEVIKRAENAIFAKATHSIKPLVVRPKGIPPEDDRKMLSEKSVDNIQISVAHNVENKNKSNTPSKLSIKDRLGSKVDVVKRKDERVLLSTVQMRSRSKTPKAESTYRRITIERKVSDREGKKNKEKNNRTIPEKPLKVVDRIGIKERKKSALDESSFVPDYDETIELEPESIQPVAVKQEEVKSVIEVKKVKNESKKRPVSESDSSSESDSNSSSSSSDAKKKKRKKRKKAKKKKARRRESDSDSDSDDSSSDEPKKKKKKQKHKKRSSKKKKKIKK